MSEKTEPEKKTEVPTPPAPETAAPIVESTQEVPAVPPAAGAPPVVAPTAAAVVVPQPTAAAAVQKSAKPDTAPELQKCYAILKEVWGKPEAQPFHHPVNWKELGLFDYPRVIKRPMDLETIETKYKAGKYNDAWDFAEDMRLVWDNAKTYNRPGSGIFLVADTLQEFWDARFKEVPKATPKRSMPDNLPRDAEQARFRFTELIKKLTSDQIGTLVDIIERNCPKALHEEDYEEDLEIEVSEIDLKTLTECNNYSNECLANKRNRKKT